MLYVVVVSILVFIAGWQLFRGSLAVLLKNCNSSY